MKILNLAIAVFLGQYLLAIGNPKTETPRIGEFIEYRIATVNMIKKLGSARVNAEIQVAGIAGYTNDKGRDSCILLPRESIVVLVGIAGKWPDHLVGRQIEIVGKLSLYPRLPPGVQARAGDEGIVLLSQVRLKGGELIRGE